MYTHQHKDHHLMSTNNEATPVSDGPAPVDTNESSGPVEEVEDAKEAKDANPTSTEKTIKKKVAKRGYGRPFAKLAQNVLDSRMQKLESRIQKSKLVYEKAQSFYVRYAKEADHRKKPVVEA